jgi:hypothetical protein
MNGFLAGVGEYGSTRFLAVTLVVTPHLHQRSRAIARRIAFRNWPAEANAARHRIRWTDSSEGRYCAGSRRHQGVFASAERLFVRLALPSAFLR